MTLPVYTPTKRTLLLDVDADTYIISDTDDEIQFFAGGSEIAEFDAAEITFATGADLAIGAADKLFFDGGGAGDTYIYQESTDDLHVVVGGAIMLQLDQEAGITTFNPSSADYNFKVLTDAGTTAINVDAGANAGKGEVGLGYTANPDGNNRAWLKIYPPALTTATDKSTSLVSIQPDYVLTMDGTVPVAATLQLEEPNLSGAPTLAATLYIKDAPHEGAAGAAANAAIWIAAGDIAMKGTSYLRLPIHDTDGTVEGSLWYDASEDKLKFKTAAGVETITSS